MSHLLFEIFKSTSTDLYREALTIRKQVFVEEQAVPHEKELDQYEESSTHFLVFEDHSPIATGRFRKIDAGYKVERVATLPTLRGKGVAAKLMLEIEKEIFSENPDTTIYLNAQIKAQNFYARLGYTPYGDQFSEAGIQHIKMKKRIRSR